MRRKIRVTNTIPDGLIAGDVVQLWSPASIRHTQLFVVSRMRGDTAVLSPGAFLSIRDADTEICVERKACRYVGHLPITIDVTTPFGGTFGIPLEKMDD